jgi:hypothetical protein
LIVSTDQSGKLVREEIYDLMEDPSETRSLNPSSVDPDSLRPLRRAIGESVPGAPGGDTPPLDGLDEETLESLRALGYVR